LFYIDHLVMLSGSKWWCVTFSNCLLL